MDEVERAGESCCVDVECSCTEAERVIGDIGGGIVEVVEDARSDETSEGH
jgi:hypothetical protein